MKRSYFIIGGGIILAILIGFWVYSFLYGSPENNEDSFFTNLGIFGQDNSVPFVPPPGNEGVPVVDVTNDPLRQLTTKPVIGMRMLTVGSSSIMRYVEAGTGHVFDIDLVSGGEVRVSNISVPVASEAVISPTGDYVAIRAGYNNQNELVLIDLTNPDNPSSQILPNQVESFAFGYNNELLFTEFNLGQTEGKGYLPSTKATRRLFIAPFTAHSMAWSNSSTSRHIIFTKPAASQIGYAYEIGANGLGRLPQSGFGLSVAQSNGIRFIGQQRGGEYVSFIVGKDGQGNVSPGATIPEKCTAGIRREDSYFCAGPIRVEDRNFPDSWYKGTVVFDDYLWEVRAGGSTLLTYPLRTVGRSIDIIEPTLSPDERMLYFRNKTDRSLWLYEI
jgi:hypothetical protein